MRISDWSSDVCSSDLVRRRSLERTMRRVEGEPHEPRAPVRRRAADDLCGLVGEQIGRIALVRGRRVIAMPIDLPLALVREIVDRAVVMAVKAGEADVHRGIGRRTMARMP